MATLLLIGSLLVVLHRSDGGEVVINSAQVTSLRTTHGSMGGLAPPGHHCLVGLTDGKFVAVLENCREVKRQLDEAK